MQIRADAIAMGDRKLAHTMDVEIRRLGYRVEPERETTQAAVMEMAVPEKPRRGRKPQPRCEHNLIIPRCPECFPEEQVA